MLDIAQLSNQPSGYVDVTPSYRNGLLLLNYDFRSTYVGSPHGLLVPNWNDTKKSATVFDSIFGPLVGGETVNITYGLRFPYADLNTAFAASGAATAFAVLVSGGNGSANYGPFVLSASGAGFNTHYPYIDGKLYLGPFSTSRYADTITPHVDVLKPHAVAATAKSGAQAFWLAGRKMATGTAAVTPSLFSGALVGSNGPVFLIAFWDRILSDAEIVELSKDPWSLFASDAQEIPIGLTAGTLPTLSAATYVPGSITSVGFRPRVTAS